MGNRNDLTNHLLIAMPALADPNFAQSVTYLCEHSEEGALGIVINRPAGLRVGELLEHLDITVTDEGIADHPVYAGGPVQRERGFVLHRPVGSWEASRAVTDELAVTTSRDILEAIARGEGPEEWLLALGYAGWGAGQLEQELAENAWLNGPATPGLLFHQAPDERWRAAAALLGVDLNRLSSESGHA
ncbi:YqgE/AlgH family protein [Arhodomonas sp. SL1]|uniref:YqgE/AlgH family protein n=1 Tax=Arhodomonas sp. SL1 TaxID=3425691 RepID=UPI003F885A92